MRIIRFCSLLFLFSFVGLLSAQAEIGLSGVGRQAMVFGMNRDPHQI